MVSQLDEVVHREMVEVGTGDGPLDDVLVRPGRARLVGYPDQPRPSLLRRRSWVVSSLTNSPSVTSRRVGFVLVVAGAANELILNDAGIGPVTHNREPVEAFSFTYQPRQTLPRADAPPRAHSDRAKGARSPDRW